MFHEVNILTSHILCCDCSKKIIPNFFERSLGFFWEFEKWWFETFQMMAFLFPQVAFQCCASFWHTHASMYKKLSSLLSRKLKYVFKICNMMFSFQDWTFETERNGRKMETSFLTFHKHFWGFILNSFKVTYILLWQLTQDLSFS